MLLKTYWTSCLFAVCGLFVAISAQAAESTEGIVRVTDRPQRTTTNHNEEVRQLTFAPVPPAPTPIPETKTAPAPQAATAGQSYASGCGCAHCRSSHHCQHGCKHKKVRYKHHHFRGNRPALFGIYGVTYPVTPYRVDPRDTRVYSAQGYGMPMAVPLAPNVRYSYNYSSGIPSSRLTPISRP